MQTPRETMNNIDGIFDALDKATEDCGDVRDQLVMQLSITVGTAVLLCISNRVPQEALLDMIRDRWSEAEAIWNTNTRSH